MGRFISLLFFIFFYSVLANAQTLPEEEFQVDFSGYFDDFNVNVIYPSISLTRKLGDNTSITGRYLVDMITAASINKSGSKKAKGDGEGSGEGDGNDDSALRHLGKGRIIDAVTAASGTGNASGGEFNAPSFDDVRNEINLGISQILGNGIFSVNGIYSSETDYSSTTMAATYQQYFAKNDASFQFGFVKSWDQVYPTTKTWTKTKDVLTLSANFSQVISKRFIIQLLGSYTENSGLLADVYQRVKLIDGTILDPVHPLQRIRKAVALKFKYRTSISSSIEAGYRYYWDSWKIRSSTYNLSFMKYVSKHTILNLGVRYYSQSRAFFFKPLYILPEEFMTVDIKLDSGHSVEYQIGFIVTGGGRHRSLPFLDNDRVEYDFDFNFYTRHSDSPYWFNNKNDLFATNFTIGFRYRLK